MRRMFPTTKIAGLCALALVSCGHPADIDEADALLPDTAALAPRAVQVLHDDARVLMSFELGLANLGAGDLVIRGDLEHDVRATQELTGKDGALVLKHRHDLGAGLLAYGLHAAHDDGLGAAFGEVVVSAGVAQSDKTYRLLDQRPLPGTTRASVTRELETTVRVTAGWVAQDRHGGAQFVELTGLPEGVYYLIAHANPEGELLEADYGNNLAWMSFALRHLDNGGVSVTELARSRS